MSGKNALEEKFKAPFRDFVKASNIREH